jgi:hypothetical protein
MVHSLFEFSIRIPISGFCQGQIECGRVFFEIESPDRRIAMGFKPLSSAKGMRLETANLVRSSLRRGRRSIYMFTHADFWPIRGAARESANKAGQMVYARRSGSGPND